MKSFNTIVSLLTISTLFAGCDTKRNPYYGDDTAQFKLSEVAVLASQPIGTNSMGLNNRMRYDMKVCIQDLSGKSIPSRQKFDVIINKEGVTRTTNREGCIQWQREVGYDRMASEKYYILTTTFVGRSEVQGQLSVDIALNPWKNEVRDLAYNSDAIPPQADTERIATENDSFKIQDITNAGPNGSSKPRPDPNPEETSVDSILPRTNSRADDATNNNPLEMAISSVTLKKIEQDLDTPFTIDENLELAVHETHEFGASVKFFTKSFDSLKTEVLPRSGEYKVTVAILDAPLYKVEDLWKEVDGLKTVKSLLNGGSKSKWSGDLQFSAQGLIDAGRLTEDTILTNDMKRRLVAKALSRYLQQTHQFKTLMTETYGIVDKVHLSFNRLAHLKTRALLAYTIQPTSPDIPVAIKADGVGYATSGLYGGWGLLHPMRVEADLIYKEAQLTKTSAKNTKPLKNYLAFNKAKRGETAIRLADTDKILKGSSFAFREDYDFLSALKKYLRLQAQEPEIVDTKTKTPEEMGFLDKRQFMAALCVKALAQPELAFLEKNKDEFKVRRNLISDCSFYPEKWLDVTQLEFVDGTPTQVEKYGTTDPKKITMSQSFSIARETTETVGGSASGKAGVSAGIDPFGLLPEGKIPAPASLSMPLSIGADWYYTIGAEKSKSNSIEATISSDFELSVEQSRFQFRTNVVRCLQVNFNSDFQKDLKLVYKNKGKLVDGFLFCADKPDTVTRIEEYYIVNQACSEELRTVNCSSDLDNKIRMVVRGKPVYDFFESLVLNSQANILLQKIPQEAVRDQQASWNKQFATFYTSQFFPGVIVKGDKIPWTSEYLEAK